MMYVTRLVLHTRFIDVIHRLHQLLNRIKSLIKLQLNDRVVSIVFISLQLCENTLFKL